MNMTFQSDNTIQWTTRETLLEHYRAIRARLGDTRTKPVPTVPRDLVHPPAPEPVAPPPPPSPPEPKPLAKSAPRFRKIIAHVAERHGVSPHDLVGESRKPRVVSARHELFYLLKVAGYSYPQVAAFCNRDHSTVLYGAKKYAASIGRTIE